MAQSILDKVVISQAKGIAKRLTPILTGVREEVVDDKYTLVCCTCTSVVELKHCVDGSVGECAGADA